MQQQIHSQHFFNLVQLQPKVFLTFNGFRAKSNFSKAYFVIRNISTVSVVYRVVQRQGDSLCLKVRPQCNLIPPGCVQRVQIINDSNKKPTLDHNVLLEVAAYDKDTSGWTGREGLNGSLIFGNLTPEFYRFLCTFSDQLHVISFQEQLCDLESKLMLLERNAYEFVDGDGARKAWLPILFMQIGHLVNLTLQLLMSIVTHRLPPVAWLGRQLTQAFFRLMQID